MKLETNKTIELVGYGHPDRFADYLGEKILTEVLGQDKNSKVAIEILATRNSVTIGGEVTTNANIDYERIVYDAIELIYGEKWWPNFNDIKVFNVVAEQSPELSSYQEQGIVAGDQGVVYGHYDPIRFERIKSLYKLMDDIKANFQIANDWKLLWNDDELSMSVCGDVNHDEILNFIIDNYEYKNVIVNPKGTWLIAGPLSDTGVVGRKLMIDTFGAGIPHGGGAFCGKDPSKVDKTGILIATDIAKELHAKYNCPITVELNYKIGDSKPKVFAYGENIIDRDVSELINESLNDFINRKDLLNKDWASYVLKGGVTSFIK